MKIRYSKILLITILFFAFIPSMMGLMIFIFRHPEISAKLGLISVKASLFAVADWNGFMVILLQFISAIGLIGFGFVTAWVFGREFTEKTIKDILPLPIPRAKIVFAKFIIVFIWGLILSLVMMISGIITGLVSEVPGWSHFNLNTGMIRFFSIALLSLLLSPPVAFFASYSRGIIAPIGFAILTMIMAQFVALVGLGQIFPWAIPGLLSAPAGIPGMQLVPSSYIILIITSLLGYFATVYIWRNADQH